MAAADSDVTFATGGTFQGLLCVYIKWDDKRPG